MPLAGQANNHHSWDGVREDFSTSKLRTGFQRALHKRPVTTELVDAAITRIEQKILALGEREIDSRRLGEMVMEELRKLDKVAYIRFASVYRDFKDVSEFRAELESLLNSKEKGLKPAKAKKLARRACSPGVKFSRRSSQDIATA